VITLPASEKPCFSGRHLEPGVEVLVFEGGTRPIAHLAATGGACIDEPEGRKVDGALWHRSSVTGNATDVTLGIGVALADGIVATAAGAIDLDGDGSPETFSVCSSSEGLHLTVWSGSVEGGRRLWHSYVYLGYDTEPTCTQSETAP
jgi:hypothetical protein